MRHTMSVSVPSTCPPVRWHHTETCNIHGKAETPIIGRNPFTPATHEKTRQNPENSEARAAVAYLRTSSLTSDPNTRIAQLLGSRHVLIARVEARRSRPRQRRHILSQTKRRREVKEDEIILERKNRLRSFQTSEPSQCAQDHTNTCQWKPTIQPRAMVMQRSPTLVTRARLKTDQDGTQQTEDRSGQIATALHLL